MSDQTFAIPAFDYQYADSDFPCLFVCEHASNYIPPAYQGLGLSESQLQEHIAWDIGARDLLESLAKELEATSVFCNYSRLLVDCNRPMGAESLMPDVSEATQILGNHNISKEERVARIDNIYAPFHAAVASQVERLRAHRSVFPVIGIHSFTPIFHGERRPWAFSLMWTEKSPMVAALIEHFQQHELRDVIGFNEPYSASKICAYTTGHYSEVHHLPTAIFEVRQDLVDTPEGVAHWTKVIKAALLEVM